MTFSVVTKVVTIRDRVVTFAAVFIKSKLLVCLALVLAGALTVVAKAARSHSVTGRPEAINRRKHWILIHFE